jgi:hypothetical protein
VMEDSTASMSKLTNEYLTVGFSGRTDIVRQELPTKPFGFATKMRRKFIDALVRVSSLESNIQYQMDKVNEMDQNDAETCIAAMSNASRESDIREAQSELNDMVAVASELELISGKMYSTLALANLSEQFRLPAHQMFLMFEPLEFTQTRTKLLCKVRGQRYSYDTQKEVIAMFAKEVGLRELESFTQELENGATRTIYSAKWYDISDAQCVVYAKSLGKVRYAHSQMLEFAEKAKQMDTLASSLASNSKAPVVLDEADSFLF